LTANSVNRRHLQYMHGRALTTTIEYLIWRTDPDQRFELSTVAIAASFSELECAATADNSYHKYLVCVQDRNRFTFEIITRAWAKSADYDPCQFLTCCGDRYGVI
jgi:hypothetical protein